MHNMDFSLTNFSFKFGVLLSGMSFKAVFSFYPDSCWKPSLGTLRVRRMEGWALSAEEQVKSGGSRLALEPVRVEDSTGEASLLLGLSVQKQGGEKTSWS